MSILGIALPILGVGGIGAAIAFIPGAAAIAGKAVAGVLAFLSKLPWYVFAIAISVTLALFFWQDARHLRKVDAGDKAALVAEQKAHAVTLASLAADAAVIDANNARIAGEAAQLVASRKQAAADQAAADQRWKGTQATVAALEADARDPKRKPCTISPEAKAALDGL